MPHTTEAQSRNQASEAGADFSSLLTIMDDLKKPEQVVLQKVLQLYLDPKAAKQTDNEKRKQLEDILL